MLPQEFESFSSDLPWVWWRNLVRVECLYMIKPMMVGFCSDMGLMLLWVMGVEFGKLAQFQDSEMSPGLFQNFMDGYVET